MHKKYMDKTAIFIIGGVVILGIAFWVFASGVLGPKIQPAQLPAGIVLFFGEECPHCKIVDEFIEQNSIKEKVQFAKVELPFAGKTSRELESNALAAVEKAQECQMDLSKGLSIPFLYDPLTSSGQAGKCFLGQEDVINFFKEKSGIK